MATATLVTSEQFLAMPDRYDACGNHIKEELIAGEIVDPPVHSKFHDLVKNNVGTELMQYLEGHAEMDWRAMIGIAFQVGRYDTYYADGAVVQRRAFNGPDRILQGAPPIAIEVIAPEDTAVHLRRKITMYLQAGAHTVWVFYDDATVMVHTTAWFRELKGDQLLEDPLLPGFAESVSAFFAI